jgi:hypothetical protein
MLGAAASARGQAGATWAIDSAGAQQSVFGLADRCTSPDIIPDCDVDDSSDQLIADSCEGGGGLSRKIFAYCALAWFECPTFGGATSRAAISPAGSGPITIRWWVKAKGFNNCLEPQPPPGCPPGPCGGYTGHGSADLDLQVTLDVENVPDGTPIAVRWRWRQFSFNKYEPEAGTDDPATVVGELTINGTDQFNGSFDLINENGSRRRSESGMFTYIVGPGGISIDVTAHADSTVSEIGQGLNCEDLAFTAFQGELVLSFAPIVESCPGPDIEFSLDIASDSELSDPTPDGLEAFDPGDVYLWHGPALPPGGANGVKDDADIFFFDDYAPTPGDPTSVADVCPSQPPAPASVSPLRFDLDGHDSLDFDLAAFIPEATPLDAPIERFPSPCVFDPDYLIVSFDDDGPAHYVGDASFGCEVPVNSVAPGPLFRTYGSAQGQDEVLGVHLVGDQPYQIGVVYPLAAESALHTSLAPDPAGGEDADDDVDSLDVVAAGDGQNSCQYWLFSADHEATGIVPGANISLDPGAIYQVTGSAAMPIVKVIDPAIHLGLSPGVDIDDFEFTWLCGPDATDQEDVLAVIFTVDDDDPVTPLTDESGGLQPGGISHAPGMIYFSTMTGSSAPLLDADDLPLLGDVDGLAIWCAPLADETPPPCPADVDADGAVDVQDLVAVILAWGACAAGPCPADVNGDSDVDVQDLVLVVLSWGPCP